MMTFDELRKSSLSPIEEAEELANLMENRLEATGLVQVVEKQFHIKQVHLLCRVRQEHERLVVHGPIESLAECADDFPELKAELFFGKSYFRKGGKLRYGWVFSFGSDDLVRLIEEMCDALLDATSSGRKKLDIMEVALVGPPTPKGSVVGSSGGGTRGAAPLRG
jgi:hypothetical protein